MDESVETIYQLSKTELLSDESDAIQRHQEVIDYIYDNHWLSITKRILDVGERNPFTERLENEFFVEVDNSSGDLDYELITPQKEYDLIICSHVIEHLMNPLLFIENAKKVLAPDGVMIIAYPNRFIKYCKHFHEIPKKDMYEVMKRASMEILDWKEYRTDHPFPLGIRPVLRIIFDKNIIFSIKKMKE